MTYALETSDSQYNCVPNIKTNCTKFFPFKSISGTFFSVDNLATGHLSGELFFEGHSSGHTESKDTGLEFLSCEGVEKRAVTHSHRHTHRRNKDNIYNRFFKIFEKICEMREEIWFFKNYLLKLFRKIKFTIIMYIFSYSIKALRLLFWWKFPKIIF